MIVNVFMNAVVRVKLNVKVEVNMIVNVVLNVKVGVNHMLLLIMPLLKMKFLELFRTFNMVQDLCSLK